MAGYYAQRIERIRVIMTMRHMRVCGLTCWPLCMLLI